MPKMLNTGYFESRYYSTNDFVSIFETDRYQLRTAMEYVTFPPPSLMFGRQRYWAKEIAEPFFPAIRDYLTGNSFLRKKDELVADIRIWIGEFSLSLQEALKSRHKYLSWTAKYNSRNVQYYGPWIVLVHQATKE